MAVPKRRTSKSKRDSRRANGKLVVPVITKCPQCGELRISHRACRQCGSYNGHDVIKQSIGE